MTFTRILHVKILLFYIKTRAIIKENIAICFHAAIKEHQEGEVLHPSHGSVENSAILKRNHWPSSNMDLHKK